MFSPQKSIYLLYFIGNDIKEYYGDYIIIQCIKFLYVPKYKTWNFIGYEREGSNIWEENPESSDYNMKI